MRLLVVSWWMPFPPDNGTRQRAYHLIEHLARRHALTLLTFGGQTAADDAGPLQQLCERVQVIPPRPLTSRGLTAAGLLSPVPRYYVQTKSPAMAAAVDATWRTHDAVLALTCASALYLMDAAAQVPAVLDEIEVGVLREQYLRELNPDRRLRHRLTWWKFARFTRLLTRTFDRSTVVSDVERQHLQAMGCDMRRVAVVPNGVEMRDSPPVRGRARRLIYPGSVMYAANLDAVRFFVTAIFPLVRTSLPDVTFMVTGATDGVDISDLARVDGVTFTGRLPDVDTLIAESAVCVVPLRIGGGTRLKILHAIALSTPVVSTTKGVEGLELEPDRDLLLADAPETFAAEVVRIVMDQPLGERLTASARVAVRDRYTWGPIAGRLEALLQSAVEDHSAGSTRLSGRVR